MGGIVNVTAGRRSWTVMLMAAVLVSTVMVQVSSSDTAKAATATNGKIAFIGRINSPSSMDIYIMDADGSNIVNATNTPDRFEFDPAWSPDGKAIAFAFEMASDGSGGIGIVDADGSNFRQVSDKGLAASPSWSPDGQWLVFEAYGKDAVLFKVRIDGTEETQISQGDTRTPAWSPDGARIAVSWDNYEFPIIGDAIVLIDPDGKNPGNLTPSPTAFFDPRLPAWSPDGTLIAFNDDSYALYTMDADGSNQTHIIEDAADPEFSPDGTVILFSWGDSPFFVPVAGGDLDSPLHWNLPTGLSSAGEFDWQPIPAPTPLPTEHAAGLVDPASGKWYLYDDTGAVATSFYFGNPGDYPFMGDWDGDGVETPGLYRQSDGYVYLRNSNTVGVADVKFFFGNPGDVPIAGDFNADGSDTVSIYRPSNQTFYIINKLGENNGGLGAAEFSYIFGNPGDKPFVGDFNGNGVETVGLHRESTGLVYFRNTHTQGNADAQFIFGDPGDRIVAGDWNADGVFSPALFRGSNTTMYFRHTNTQGNADNQFVPMLSGADWLPVAGVMK